MSEQARTAIVDSDHVHAWEEYGDDKGRWLSCRCGDRMDLGRRLGAFLVPKKKNGRSTDA